MEDSVCVLKEEEDNVLMIKEVGDAMVVGPVGDTTGCGETTETLIINLNFLDGGALRPSSTFITVGQ